MGWMRGQNGSEMIKRADALRMEDWGKGSH